MRSGVRALILLAVFALGVGTAIAVARPPQPAALATAPKITVVPTVSQEFVDTRAVKLAFALGPERAIVAGSAGIVTAVACTVGGSIASGKAAVRIGGAPVIALATSIPLWRDLEVGMSGVDVAALNTEIARLGHPAPSGDTVDWATLQSVRDLYSSAGGAGDALDVIPAAAFAWIAAPAETIAGCPVAIGERVEAATDVIMLPRDVGSARVSSWPSDLVPGERAVRVGTVEFPVDVSGNLGREDLARVVQTPQFRAMTTAAASDLDGTLVLRRAITAIVVPPSSLRETGGAACLNAVGGAISVRVLGSELGRTFVEPVDGAPPPSRVRTTPPTAGDCS